MNNDIINFDKAGFSVAMIDLNQYIQTLMNVDKYLTEANFILGKIDSHNLNPEDYSDMVKEYAFKPYAKVNKYLKDITEKILKYEAKLNNFFDKNQQEKEEFYAKLDILIPLIEEKQQLAKEKLKICFDYIKQVDYVEQIDDLQDASSN